MDEPLVAAAGAVAAATVGGAPVGTGPVVTALDELMRSVDGDG